MTFFLLEIFLKDTPKQGKKAKKHERPNMYSKLARSIEDYERLYDLWIILVCFQTNNISRFIDFPHSYGVDKLPFSRELGRKQIIAYLLPIGRVRKFGFASVHRKMEKKRSIASDFIEKSVSTVFSTLQNGQNQVGYVWYLKD